ncbi:hypothetical protein [Krasilnikovia sp. MM14-A1259]|uniref:hypothetical protein n=1 Tax=Krasilnikovia sp. MM14-A1259 TaxID=3373539 RepID=UPI0038268A04
MAPPRRAQRRGSPGLKQLFLGGLGTLILAGVCGLSAFVVSAHTRRSQGAQPRPPAQSRDLSSRRVDAAPLTLEEVFPGAEIRAAEGAATYRIAMTHIDTDCGIATIGELGALLVRHGCTQVVRAALTAPYGGYRVTAGIFNLSDAAGARLVAARAGQLVAAGEGTFAAMLGGLPGTDPELQPATVTGWDTRGHFLLYCVIVRPDGRPVSDGDPFARRIIADLVQAYLGDTVLGRRTPLP